MPERADYSQETINTILDTAFLCHVGFSVDGKPFVIPTGYGRQGAMLYIHGSAASRMLRTMTAGVEVCVAVTLLDGVVLARSAFHHSMNYRSVVLFGTARAVESEEEKTAALRVISEQIMPGRWDDVRKPTEKELKATAVLSMPIAEASAKIRSGPPCDDEADYALDVWAGVLPMRVEAGIPQPDKRLKDGNAPTPTYLSHYGGPNGGKP